MRLASIAGIVAGALGVASALNGMWDAYGAQRIGAPGSVLAVHWGTALLKAYLSARILLRGERKDMGRFAFGFAILSLLDVDRFSRGAGIVLVTAPAAVVAAIVAHYAARPRATE